MESVGEDGVITVEDSDTIDTYYDVVEGMQFDREYISPYFVTDPKKMEVFLEKPLILVTDQEIKNAQDMVPLLEKVVQSGRPILIIAKDVTGEALTTLVLNKLKGTPDELRGQGARLRRSPQGDARGYRGSDRRNGRR